MYNQLMEELEREDVAAFANLLRVSPQMFQEIVDRLTPTLCAKDRGLGGRPPPFLLVSRSPSPCASWVLEIATEA